RREWLTRPSLVPLPPPPLLYSNIMSRKKATMPLDLPKSVDPKDILCRILSIGEPGKELNKTVSEGEIMVLIAEAKKQFEAAPPCVTLKAPVRICGDTHGQFGDVLRLFQAGGFPPASNYLFLGDYVDRGRQNLETVLMLMCYKLMFPANLFLLRGNHECARINKVYGFYTECLQRYTSRVWEAFQDTFTQMPLTAVVADRIVCMHGGLSPKLKTLAELLTCQRGLRDYVEDSMELDLLWADPVEGIQGFEPNPRGASCGFGKDVVQEFCEKNDIDLIVRAHQVVQDGYEFFAARKLVTIFSAPHYCGQYDNRAAMLCVAEDLQCRFEVMEATILTVKERDVSKDATKEDKEEKAKAEKGDAKDQKEPKSK
ncbi:hypothetical protein PRIPAC_74605, partial [Pristionchus pacificus]